MAEAKAEPKADAAPKSKKNILLIVVIALLVLLLVLGGLVAFFLLKSPAEGNADEAVAEANSHAEEAKKKKKEKEKGEKHAPIFAKLQDQAFTVNLAGDTESVLQAEIMVEVSDEVEKEKLTSLQPKIQDAVNRLLRSKTLDEVKTTKGQEDLAREIREKLNEIMEVEGKDEGILSVNFTKYFYQ